MAGLVFAPVVSTIAVPVGFLACLALCAFIVVRTGKTAGLRDLAVAVRGFRGALNNDGE